MGEEVIFKIIDINSINIVLNLYESNIDNKNRDIFILKYLEIINRDLTLLKNYNIKTSKNKLTFDNIFLQVSDKNTGIEINRYKLNTLNFSVEDKFNNLIKGNNIDYTLKIIKKNMDLLIDNQLSVKNKKNIIKKEISKDELKLEIEELENNIKNEKIKEDNLKKKYENNTEFLKKIDEFNEINKQQRKENEKKEEMKRNFYF